MVEVKLVKDLDTAVRPAGGEDDQVVGGDGLLLDLREVEVKRAEEGVALDRADVAQEAHLGSVVRLPVGIDLGGGRRHAVEFLRLPRCEVIRLGLHSITRSSNNELVARMLCRVVPYVHVARLSNRDLMSLVFQSSSLARSERMFTRSFLSPVRSQKRRRV